MIIFFFKFKKPCFWPISGQFPNFRAKVFSKTPTLPKFTEI